MSLLGLAIFCFCFWTVFSRNFDEGILAKHFFSLAAICAILLVIEPDNHRVVIGSVVALALGFYFWYNKHSKNHSKQRHRHF